MKDKSTPIAKTVKLDARHKKAVERLRESKPELETFLRDQGKIAGRNFVLEEKGADALMFCRLECLDEDHSAFCGLRDLIGKVLCAGSDIAGDHWLEYRDRYGYEIDAPEWVNGFIEGALETFRKLEQHL